MAERTEATVIMGQLMVNVQASDQNPERLHEIQRENEPKTTQCRSKFVLEQQAQLAHCHCAYLGSAPWPLV